MVVKIMISSCMICYNEQDLIMNCLCWLDSLSYLDEICIIDSFSTDNTWEIIKGFKTHKKFKIKQQNFLSFGAQKNDCISMASGDWILMIDADETYSYMMNQLLHDIHIGAPNLEGINAFRIATVTTYPDKKHRIVTRDLDPHIRLWKKDFAKYRGECHEELFDINNRGLHRCYDKDILTLWRTKEYNYIVMLHHQRLKSREALIEKGERWSVLGMMPKSAERGLPVHKLTWVNLQDRAKKYCNTMTAPLNPKMWDYRE